jgi:CubicO group peptidase (beta-lactamase class C family)
MKSIIYKLLFVAVLFSLVVAVAAQPSSKQLTQGAVTGSGISAGEKHNYAVELEKDDFVFIRVMQQGIDLAITAFDPKGGKIAEFDSPNGTNGPEFVSIDAASGGVYRFEVKPLNAKTDPGRYDMRVVRIEKRATTKAGRIDQLFAAWDNDDAPGASVAVVKDGKIVFTKGYGLANLEYGIPNSPSTVFHIASVSKQFTAFAALLLEADGKLSMDDDVRKYIPELHDFGKTITLRHLANHTSGLRDQWSLLGLGGWRIDDVITREHILKLVSRQRELNFEPGAEYLYCNTGYTLLAETVARVSKKSFAEFTDERIFKPLNMKSTLFYDDHEKIVKNRAYSYGSGSGGYKKAVLSYANVGATSLFTTVEDLSLWAVNFENPVVGNKDIVEKMKVRGVLNSKRKISYALGQTVGKYRGFDVISHGGGDAGYRTFLSRFPTERLAVVVFSNDGSFNSGDMANKVADVYLGKPVVAAGAPKPKAPAAPKAFPVPAATLDAYAGNWEVQPGVVLAVSRNGSVLSGRVGSQTFTIVPVSMTGFIVQGPGIEVEFIKGADGKYDKLKWSQNGQANTVRRIEPYNPDAKELAEYTGKFYSDELETAYVFRVKDGKLSAEHSRHPDFELTPAKTDVFNGSAWFFGRAEFIRDKSKKIVSMKVSSGRIRNVVFRKMH